MSRVCRRIVDAFSNRNARCRSNWNVERKRQVIGCNAQNVSDVVAVGPVLDENRLAAREISSASRKLDD